MINKYKKYKTRVGHDVAIYEVYTEGSHPVHGAYFFDGAWTIEAWTSDGFTMAGIENEQDIFEAEVIDGSLTARLRAEEINEFATHPEGLLAEAADRIESQIKLIDASGKVHTSMLARVEELEAALREKDNIAYIIDRHGITHESFTIVYSAALGEKKDGN
jgi:hypothetical protein